MSDVKNEMTDAAGVSRRRFLQAAGLTAAAATATGAGAALLARRNEAALQNAANIVAAVPPAAAAPNPAQANTTQLLVQLAEAQAENRRLQVSLAAAERRLQAQSADVNAATAATEPLVIELETAQAQVGVLAGLVALYEQLDEVDLADAWEAGKTAVVDSFDDLLAEAPLLRQGITAGQQVLDEMDDHIPRLQDGRRWLETQADQLGDYYENVRALLASALEASGPILEMLQNWFEEILQWLPFGLGRRAATIMESITNLVTQIPFTVSGMNSNVAQPLDKWLATDADGEVTLRKSVIKPLRDNLMPQAEGMASRAEQASSTYQTELVTPLETAVAHRNTVRELITQYREEHNLA